MPMNTDEWRKSISNSSHAIVIATCIGTLGTILFLRNLPETQEIRLAHKEDAREAVRYFLGGDDAFRQERKEDFRAVLREELLRHHLEIPHPSK